MGGLAGDDQCAIKCANWGFKEKRRVLEGMRRCVFGDGAGLFAGAGIGEGLVDELGELTAVNDFDKGCAFAVVGDDPDGRGVLNADALTESVIGFDQCNELALGVDGKGQGDVVVGRKLLGELGKGVKADNGWLAGEDGVAVLVTEGLALKVKPAGVDGGVHAPVMEGEREIVADPRDFVGGGHLSEEGVGTGTVWTLEVFKFDEGDAGSCGWTERGGVVDLGSGGRSAELSVGTGCCGNEKQGGDEQEQAGTDRASGNGTDRAIKMHGGWTAP